jgi:hypothetical protein
MRHKTYRDTQRDKEEEANTAWTNRGIVLGLGKKRTTFKKMRRKRGK